MNDRKPIVLAVDDNPNNLGVLSEFLDESGFEVWIARSGETAIDRVSYARPDLILLDVMMPGIDGFETCRRLQENAFTCDIPIIFTTALTDTVDKVKGLSLGAVDYITKPFQQEEVLARVKLHLRLHFLTKKVEEQNVYLETRVQERTAQLNDAIDELKQAQVRLVQSEKMSSLGQLVAGVAHEINNPVNFIYGNATHARDYADQFLEILKLYQKYHPEPEEEIVAAMEEYDFDFLVADFPNLLDSMKVGADRLRDIVRSLRNFSRSDEAELKAIDIHDGINSTLTILNNRIKAKFDRPGIDIIKNYGDLPEIECYPGPLNQVFMNLLANAIDAIEEKDDRDLPGEICIQTETLDNTRVRITISDNGQGIKEEVCDRLFDAFFTTKPMSKGTGLGLAISYAIVVQTHGGDLRCESEWGRGTSMIVELPVVQKKASQKQHDTGAIAARVTS